MAKTAKRPFWMALVGPLGGIFLGAVLLFAAWAKILDPSSFVEQIRLEGLDLWLPAVAVAFLALALEVGLGALLVLGVRRWWVLVPSALLVLFFLWLTGRNYWLTAQGLRDAGASCGCFGSLVERSPAEAFWQDLLLLVPSLLLAFVGFRHSSRRGLAVRGVLAAAVTAVALFVAWKAPELPLDNLATRLRPGAEPAGLCVGPKEERVCLTTVAPQLAEGRHLVILASLEDPIFQAAVPALNEFVLAGPEYQLLVLSTASAEEQRAFVWKFDQRFEIREAPEALLRPLYRTLPRSFTVDEGRVLETFSGLPPFARILDPAAGAEEPSVPANES